MIRRAAAGGGGSELPMAALALKRCHSQATDRRM
jgi:hypothetical protein